MKRISAVISNLAKLTCLIAAPRTASTTDIKTVKPMLVRYWFHVGRERLFRTLQFLRGRSFAKRLKLAGSALGGKQCTRRALSARSSCAR